MNNEQSFARSDALPFTHAMFVNHSSSQCGVYEWGANIGRALTASPQNNYHYVECDGIDAFRTAYTRFRPDVIFFNYYDSTQPWVSPAFLRTLSCPTIGVFHEVTQSGADCASNGLFDFWVAPDPTLLLNNPLVYKIGRLIPDFHRNQTPPSMPTIGSFGFGLPGKGFERLVAAVQLEFDDALIRLRIPYAQFGDPDGIKARDTASRCRQLIYKKGVRLEIDHEFVNPDQILAFLAGNTLNAFYYDDYPNRGISSVTDYALAVRRPLAITRSGMFRHLFESCPSICVEQRTLRQIIESGNEPLLPYQRQWTKENIVWDFNRAITQALSQPNRRPSHKDSIGRKTLSLAKRVVRKLISPAPAKSRAQAVTHLSPLLRPHPNIHPSGSLNRILDSQSRNEYAEALATLFYLTPDVIYRKIFEANIQQAFMLNTCLKYIREASQPRILCVGSYEDTAAISLKRLGYPVTEIDPLINYDLTTFVARPSTVPASYNLIFSTSVIEHVPDDEQFVTHIANLLAPGGVAVLTCDFNDQYKPGDLKPTEDQRLYTQEDLKGRLLPAMKGCRLVDEPNWNCPSPDFVYQGKYRYTFASFVVRKDA
jgi:SAM-dependent methyltransferase